MQVSDKVSKTLVEHSKPSPRTIHRSKIFLHSTDPELKGEGFVRTQSYVKPKFPGEIKGKLNLKFAKRQRVKPWKAAKEVS